MFIWLCVLLFLSCCEGLFKQSLDLSFKPGGTSFHLAGNTFDLSEEKVKIATASNVDNYELIGKLGFTEKSLRFGGQHDSDAQPNKVSVHLFNQEIDESTKSVHFLCHATDILSGASNNIHISNENSRICCVVSVNTTFSHEISSCLISNKEKTAQATCHTSVKLPIVVWKQSILPKISLSFATFHIPDHKIKDFQFPCDVQRNLVHLSFKKLPSATISRSVSDAIRELGGSLLLQVPRRELRTNEEFAVSVRLKHSDEVSDFTIRCEVPANSYVEFVRVIWPGGISSWKHSDPNQIPLSQAHQLEEGIHSLWDVFHRSMMSQKRNITEVVARLREDLVGPALTERTSQAVEVYKLLFRVNRPPAEASGRVAPRIFWSLVSMGRQHSPDRTMNASPIVTRLNIEPSQFTHLAMVIKTTALVNLAALTGQPTTYPVWVYGLTHSGEVLDVTDRATCHTGDDAVIHFANDACNKLGFSGIELDGSPGLPLVAKLDGRSATATLLVWFPKSPALRLVVDQSPLVSVVTDHLVNEGSSVLLKQLVSTPKYSSWTDGAQSSGTDNSTESPLYFHHLPVRVLARFILAGSVLYDKDVLGGRIDQYVDVTQYTAHRLHVESIIENQTTTLGSDYGRQKRNLTATLLLLYRAEQTETRRSHGVRWSSHSFSEPIQTHKPLSAWLIGRRNGRARICLKPIDRSKLITWIPPGLEKQLKDHQQQQQIKQQQQMAENHINPQPTANHEDELNLDVLVSEEQHVWPVGMSAQLVSDFTMTAGQPVEDSQTTDPDQTLHTLSNLSTFDRHSFEETVLLYSSLYHIHIQMIGTRWSHSGSVPDRVLQPLQRLTESKVEVHNSNRDYLKTLRRLNETRFLIIWIHLSDGTSIFWNRLVEIYRALDQPVPFRLFVDNLRPDLFRILEAPSATRVRLNKRNVNRFWSKSHEGNSPNVWVHPDEGRVESTNEIEWNGPVVQPFRPGNPFTGDIMELSLHSLSGQPLITGLRLPDINSQRKASETTKEEEAQLNAESIDIRAEGVSQRLHEPFGGLLSKYQKQNPPTSQQDVTAHKTFPGANKPSILKDAPKWRSHPTLVEDEVRPVDGRLSEKIIPAHLPQDETSLSDQTREEKYPSEHDANSLRVVSKAVKETQSDSRSVLETSMYVLLGLFALVGLVFAVNCGAVVARYRWERGRQGRPLTGTVTSDLGSKRMEAVEEATDTYKLTQNAELETSATTIMKRYAQQLLGRTKNKPSLHKDDNWIWISRERKDRIKETTLIPSKFTIHNQHSLGLNTLTPGTQLSIGRSQSFGNPNPGTTAVLSVGEADVLLLHSPYRRVAWQDHVELSPTEPSETHSLNHDATDPWKMLHSDHDQYQGVRSLRRPARRHTTISALTQRNYQGQECSIRLISNPMPAQTSAIANQSANQSLKNMYLGATHVHMGSASVSMRRRHKRQITDCEPNMLHQFVQLKHKIDDYNTATVTGLPDERCTTRGEARTENRWEQLIYRSWLRPSNLMPNASLATYAATQMADQTCFTQAHSLAEEMKLHRDSINLQQSNRMKLDGKHKESTTKPCVEVGQNNYDSEVPKPPLRTTSRLNTYHTLDQRKAVRITEGTRPLSLPQNFQASNDLYSALNAHTCSTEATTLFGSQTSEGRTATSKIHHTPSEESLWWYHPVRQKRRADQQIHEADRHIARLCQPTELMSGDRQQIFVSDSSNTVVETPEYACPAACDCVPKQPLLTVHPNHLPPGPPEMLNPSNVTSASDLAWEKDLMALSHDRLVAYFAEMRESMA